MSDIEVGSVVLITVGAFAGRFGVVASRADWAGPVDGGAWFVAVNGELLSYSGDELEPVTTRRQLRAADGPARLRDQIGVVLLAVGVVVLAVAAAWLAVVGVLALTEGM